MSRLLKYNPVVATVGASIFNPPSMPADTITLADNSPTSDWIVTQTDFAGTIDVDDTFASFDAVYNAANATTLGSDCKVILPAGDFTGQSFNFDLGSIWVEGQVDGNNDPTTHFEGQGGQGSYINLNTADDTAVCHFKQVSFGRNSTNWKDANHSGTAQDGSANTITLAAGASATDDFYVNHEISITGGTSSGSAELCTAYDGTTKVATVESNWDNGAPDNTSTYDVDDWPEQENSRGMYMSASCTGILERCIFRGMKEMIYGQDSHWKQRMTNGFFKSYGVQMVGAGGGINHGLYVHHTPSLFVNCVLHNPRSGLFGHVVKLDTGKSIFLNSIIGEDIPDLIAPPRSSTSALINQVQFGEFLMQGCITYVTGAQQTFGCASRKNMAGGMNLLYPGPGDTSHMGLTDGMGDDWQFISGGTTSTDYNAVVDGDVSQGATTLVVDEISGRINDGQAQELSTLTAYDIRVDLDNATIQEFTSITPSSAGSGQTATFTGLDTFTNSAGNHRSVAIKENADSWDKPEINQDYYRSDGNSWFDRVNDGSGYQDIDHAEAVTQWFIDNMFILDGKTGQRPFYSTVGGARSFRGTNNARTGVWPAPPANDTKATPRWDDDVNAGNLDSPLDPNATRPSILGDQPADFTSLTSPGTNSNFVWPATLVVKDLGIALINTSTLNREFTFSATGVSATSHAYEADHRWLNSSGTIVQVTTSDESPLPTGHETTLSGNHAQGATTLVVADDTNLAVGQKIQIALATAQFLEVCRDYVKPHHSTTIATKPGGGTITIDDGLHTAINDGANIVAFTAAGSNASEPDPEDWD